MQDCLVESATTWSTAPQAFNNNQVSPKRINIL
jgi:hypothetical protein